MNTLAYLAAVSDEEKAMINIDTRMSGFDKIGAETSLRWSAPTGVNFTNILWAAFAPKSFRKKLQTQIVST